MKHFIIVAILILLLGCQNSDYKMLPAPDEPSMDVQLTLNSSTLVLYQLTNEHREFIATELKKRGYSLSSEELALYCQFVSVTIQTLQSEMVEMPESLRYANIPWGEITRQNSNAAQFVQKLEHKIVGNLTAIDTSGVLHPCLEGGGQSWSSCFDDFVLVCNYFGVDTCVSLTHILNLFHCLINCYPEPHTHFP